MNQEESSPKPCILVAPLDWGLGHATRCIPIIHALLGENYCVIIAAEGRIKDLLLEEFPTLFFVPLAGYNIRYSRRRWLLPLIMLWQMPRILSVIRREHKWLQEAVKRYAVIAVISDNRYGLYHADIPCFFITHQLQIRTPVSFLNHLLQRLNYRFINRYTECWVPDEPVFPGYSGMLAHPQTLPLIPVHYTGILTRFHPSSKENKENHLLVILSGPEPQRSILEDILLEQLKTYKDPVVMVRGLPGKEQEVAVTEHITVYDHLPARQLEEKIKQATFVISRCGYSTVMDLMALKKKAIFIPTPGQTEQEYLSELLSDNQYALCIPQNKFNLHEAIQQANKFAYRFKDPDQYKLKDTIQHLNEFLHTSRTLA